MFIIYILARFCEYFNNMEYLFALDFFLFVCYTVFKQNFKGRDIMILQESGEMYLETIYILLKEKKDVRSIDVVDYMHFSKPSVSRAIGLLKGGGFVTVDENGFLGLTEAGVETAEKIYERHRIITAFLEGIGVSYENASADACKIEHIISDDSFYAIKKLVEAKNDN